VNLKTITEVKDYSKQFPQYKKAHDLLRIHTNITNKVLSVTRDLTFRETLECEQNMLTLSDSEKAMNYIEECINKQAPFSKVFRLLCLYSLTHNGIGDKYFNQLRRDLLQNYGYECLFFMENLMKLGMFKLNTSRVNLYARIKEDLKIIVEGINEKEPNDVAYVYSGYAPISIRLVQQALASPSPSKILSEYKDESPATDASSIFSNWAPGRTAPAFSSLPMDQKFSISGYGWGDQKIDSIVGDLPGGQIFHSKQILPKSSILDKSKDKLVLVYFVGGCTFAEISALRYLGQKMEGYNFIVATTKLWNGSTFLDSMKEKFSTVSIPKSKSKGSLELKELKIK